MFPSLKANAVCSIGETQYATLDVAGKTPAFVVDNAAYMAKDMQPTSVAAISLAMIIALGTGSIFFKKPVTAK